MAARQGANGAAKPAPLKANSRAPKGPKPGDGGSDAGASRVRSVRRRRVPAAGERLRDELGRDGDPFAVALLIEQAARHADRLDVLNDLLSGDSKAWFEVQITGGQVAEVRVTNLMVEERQRSAALQRCIVDIQRMRGEKPVTSAKAEGGAKASPIARIQQGRNK